MRERPGEDYIYHIYNRGVDKREIFSSDEDRKRFLACLECFNTIDQARSGEVYNKNSSKDSQDKLVEILAFSLMPNHYHLLIKPLVDNGVSEFMRKLGVGYTHYFNIKNERSGSLFQGKYKFVRIENEEQLNYIPFYIHFNPAELIESGWKDKVIRDKKRLLEFLHNYQWSSLGDYLGNDRFGNIINKSLLSDYLGTPGELEKEITTWLDELHFEDHTNLWIE